MKILVVIPARGGSKGLPRKNLLEISGISLVGRAVRIARRFLQAVGLEGTVLVDTDSEEIRAEGQRWGAFVPFLRPDELASDTTPVIDNVLHAVDRITALRGEHDVVVVLQPTSPLRAVEDVVACFRTYTADIGSVVSISPPEHPPEQALRCAADGTLTWAFADLTQAGEHLPAAFRPSGSVYVSSVASLRAHRAFIVPGRTRGVSMPLARSVEVDHEEDLALARALSEMAPAPPVRVGSHCIGDGHATFVVADAGGNHDGDPKVLHRLIDVAADAGTSAVKLDTFDPAHPVSRELHGDLFAHAAERGLVFLTSPVDERSADFLEELGVPAFDLSSGELTNHPLLAHVARKRKPMLVSTGMADLPEVDAALDAIYGQGPAEVALLHCVTGYPAHPEDANLSAMQTLREAFGVPTGYGDHTQGLAVSLAAVAMGAELVEKHFALDRSMPGHRRAALTPDELSALVAGIRTIESARGDGAKKPRPIELPLIVSTRKSLHAARDLPLGHVLVAGDVVALRPGNGISPARLPDVIGRKLTRPLAAGILLAEDDVD